MTPIILQSIQCERDRQDQKWGGAEHDDQHSRDDWFEFIQWQIDAHKANPGVQRVAQARYSLVKIAALAIAAIESIDRREAKGAGGYGALPPPEHAWQVGKTVAEIEAEKEKKKTELRIIRLEQACRSALLSMDAAWEIRNEGHDWADACKLLRAALEGEE